ncbi:hypothetical protein V500_09518 [Pseudogymnoascus sp. VKM F-4518 (FW-2643)]|nr:hypothetical protein V500_09518 [Pseudogymnoascus sp. VKM F-4518 (FW-2643)]
MSSSSSETDGSVVGAGDNGRSEDRGDEEWGQQHGDGGEGRISDMLEEEIAASATPAHIENGVHGEGYGNTDEAGSDFGDVSPAHTPIRNGSPADSMMSIPDDTPSVQGSVMSSPGSSVLPSMASRQMLGSPTPSFRPFDRRFSSRLAPPSGVYSPRALSPAFYPSHSRQVSLNSQVPLDGEEVDTPSPPWEVVRWTKLKKMNGQTFSEVGKRNFGTPTCIAVSASIVVGTSKGIILVFDYHQNLKSIIGQGTKAVESGAVSSIAISADHSTVAGGHVNGDIFTWEIAKSSRPFLHIPAVEVSALHARSLDGHVPNVAITHLGFLGTRHTAIVSADDRGMAFSHLATRGTGAVGRRVKTTRILGRYPNDSAITGKPRKPSTILAFASLPLGNVERGTDTLGLTAMLTPYLLVIVSTTPVAETQHKAARPKEIAAHGAMSGCLAWFPAVKLKVKDPETGDTVSKVKLVYCWSNVLTIMDVEEFEAEGDKQPSLNFRARSRWKSDEAIVAVQWLSRSVLGVLTITQRLIILEDHTMRMTEAFDLLYKHIYHKDLFSDQLHSLVEQLDEDDSSMHGVVADAFYMSFRAYKGRMFLLGFNDISIGAVSNWADRLIALMENGDYIGAINLATSYFTGDADKLTIGLPEDTGLRHSIVRDKLLEIMTASLKFAFGSSKTSARRSERETELKELAQACFAASLAIDDTDYLFDDVYEWYEDGDFLGIFLEALEPYILEEEITSVPPIVVKSLVSYYVSEGLESRLEEILCRMETATFDIDQITALCKENNLYDALIYIWTQALGDYIAPLVYLLKLLVPLVQDGGHLANGQLMDDPLYGVNALKMFPYMSYTLTGRVYPTGQPLTDEQAQKAKSEIYWFLFSGNTITWPVGSSKPFLTMPHVDDEPSFPYLRMILKYDAPSLLSSLNEAFEDPFLNDTHDEADPAEADPDMREEQLFGQSVNRQYIISILLEVMNRTDFAPEDTIYLDMFIARNLPKFPQYLLLSGTSLHKILTGLCNYPGDDIADDAQLSAEYLLSIYHPTDIQSLIPLFRKAKFFRALKNVYKSAKQYGQLLQTYFEDPEDQELVFGVIGDCLRAQGGPSPKQIDDIHGVIRSHARDLVAIDAVKSAQTVAEYCPELHQDILDTLSEDPEHEYRYLQAILEPEKVGSPEAKPLHEKLFIERYVLLMCSFDALHVAEYVEAIQESDLRLDKVLPAMEDGGVVDAAVILMAREGLIGDAMKRLTEHLGKLEGALTGLLQSNDPDMHPDNLEEAAEVLLESLQKYTGVGIWLCKKNSKTPSGKELNGTRRRKSGITNAELNPQESLWLELIDAVVQITKNLSSSLLNLDGFQATNLDGGKLLFSLRSLVQSTFTALLTATSGPSEGSISFLRILRAFLTRASVSSPTITDLRAVLTSIFSAYAYEESILGLANRLLDKDLFVNVDSASHLRKRGWRPRGSVCEGCHRRAWGPGVAGDVLGQWEGKQAAEALRREERWLLKSGGAGHGKEKAKSQDGAVMSNMDGKGKAKAFDGHEDAEDREDGFNGLAASKASDLGPLVVFACRHLYHRQCLEAALAKKAEGTWKEPLHDGREFRCPIDG